MTRNVLESGRFLPRVETLKEALASLNSKRRVYLILLRAALEVQKATAAKATEQPINNGGAK